MTAKFDARSRRHLLYATVIAAVAVLASYGSLLPIFRSHLMVYLGIGDEQFGLLFGVGPMASLASVLLGGTMIDRWGPRRVIRICLVGVGASMLIVAMSGANFAPFVMACGLGGLFMGPLHIATNAYLAKLFPRHQRRIVSLNLATSSFGGMMFPLVAEGLLAASLHWPAVSFAYVLHGPFLITGMLLLAASAIYRKRIDPAGEPICRPDVRPWHWRDLLLPPRAWFIAVLISVHVAVDTTLNIWMPRFLESRSFDSQPFPPGLVLSGAALAYLLSRALLAALPDHVGRRAFLVLPGIIGGCIVVAGIFSRNYMLTAGGYVLGSFCWSAEYPAMISTLLRHDRRRFGAAMALSGLVAALLLFFTMNLTGYLVKSLGDQNLWKVMLGLGGGFCLVGVGGSYWLLAFQAKASAAALTTTEKVPASRQE